MPNSGYWRCAGSDNLFGVTLAEGQLPDLTELAVAALGLTVRNG